MAQQSGATLGGPLNVVGKRGPNIDAVERVTGRAKYTGDIDLPGMLVGRALRSPHAHARLVKVDTSKAEALPGVRAVITYRDMPKVMVWGHRHYGMQDRVRYKGDPVAVVAAVNSETADKALKLIDIDYDVLPFVLDPEEALKPGAPQLFPDGNQNGDARGVNRGNVEQGFAQSDKVIERVYHIPTMWSGSMEPRACVAHWEGDHLTLYASTQAPFRIHSSIATALDLPDENVRVIASYVGGGFGTKSAPHTDEILAVVLARKARLPVLLQYTREEEILDSNTRFEVRMYVKLGVKKDMSIQALQIRAYANLGAYHTRVGGLGNQSTHVYKTPHVKTEIYRAHTNIPNTGPTRGVGDPQENFAVESIIDEMAYEMGWDPMEFRLKNIKRNGDPIARAGDVEDGKLVTQALDKCIEEGAARVGWTRRNAVAGGPAGAKVRGIGFAVTERGGGGGTGGATVKVNLDGSAHVSYASCDIGTGSRTTLAMVASEVLGVPLSKFRTTAGDTDAAPYDGGSIGNRTLQGTGRAVEAAARDALRQIFASAAPMLDNAPATDLEIVDSMIRVKANPSKSLKLADVMQRRGRSVVGVGATTQPQTGVNVERTSAAHFAEVEVDRESGKVRIVKYIAAHDVGRPINVTICENQLEGGSIQGLALTQAEELRFDPRDGKCLNASFLDLKPPTALDFDPRVIEAVLVPNESVGGPFGAKGLGENPCHPGMAAVANAIYNAIGVRLREVPFTRPKILAALNEQRPAGPSRTA
jgi:xanthine dehydrogenase molybdenum-binding subunit